MKKEYITPEVEIISLISTEAITDDSLTDGEYGDESSIFD